MSDLLGDVLGGDDDSSVDRILATAFFRKRPLQAGSSPHHVVSLADRRIQPRERFDFTPESARPSGLVMQARGSLR